MSYSHSFTADNAGYAQEFSVYICDVTGEEIGPGHPHFPLNDNTHISYNGVYELMESMLLNGFHAGFMPYVMEELLDRYFTKKKHNRYIRPDVRKKVLEKYSFACVKCSSTENLTIDHIVPVVEGGKNGFPNLQVLCKTCNCKKGKKSNKSFMEINEIL
jgi:hypothetical protein